LSVNHVEPRPRRNPLAAWAPLGIAVILAGCAIQAIRANLLFNTEEAALGEQTTPLFGEVDGLRVQCGDQRDTALCLASYRKAGSPPAVLWLGNSQLHGVNRLKAGDKTAPMLVHEALAPKGRYLVAYSEPNANLLEHQALFRQLKPQYAIETLLLSVCLDDFRETGIRPGIVTPVPTEEEAVAHIGKDEAFSPQPVVEAWLETTLADHFGVWRDRESLKALFRYGVFQIRNRALGINSQTKRPVSQAQYEEKLAALKAIIAEANGAGIKVVLYTPAYRQDIPGPYVKAQYDALIADLKAMTVPGKVSFVDMTTAVPGPEWGMIKDSLFGFEDYDFMHFTAEGHRRLAAGLIPAL